MSELVKVEGDEIVIRVPVGAIPNAAQIAWEKHYGRHNISVEDACVFARELLIELRREAEDGTTLVDLMLDQACVRAAENGALGLSS